MSTTHSPTTHSPTTHSPAAAYHAVADGVFCIETGLYRDGLAACYLMRQRDRLAVIDTGTAHSVPGLLGVIKDLGLTPGHVDYVIPTHVHLDHAGGAGTLMAACPNATLVVHPKGAPHLIDPAKLIAGASAVYGADAFAEHFGTLEAVPEQRVIAAGDGQTFDLAGRKLTFIHSPGHANHHGCLFDAGSHGLFTGDTFGIAYPELARAAKALAETANAEPANAEPARAEPADAEPALAQPADAESAHPELKDDANRWLFAPTTPVAFDPDAWLHSLDRLLAFEPKVAFLTHYGRLDDPARYAEPLRRSIRDLAALALAQSDAPAPERKDRIKDALSQHLLADARAHGCSLYDDPLRERLAIDLELNAQGLEVWLQRRDAQGL
jgi:glyoxylase-like metal-dependent hydrolase (beta-lactamase superfamily II)